VVVRDTTPKFGYIILDDIPEELAEYNEKRKGWERTPFNTFYKMVSPINLYLEAMTFTTLIDAAKKRHTPFFNRLFAKSERSVSSRSHSS
jgi:hypothetical protein